MISPPENARDSRVLVTGATGYVAGWLIKRLLGAGATVHATVRDPDDADRIAHLRAMADAGPGSIDFFRANLLEAGSHDEAMRGCTIVFHTASPFLTPAKVGDPQRDLVEPALRGTRDVLETAARTPGVERVVLTSSCAAISGGPADLARAPEGGLTEAGWNTVSTLAAGPYPYSKMLAERAAWEIAEAQDRWRLVVINPALVLGPGTAASQTSASFDHLRMIGDGTYGERVPPFELGMVDVRDVAEAHFRAGFLPDAEGRHIVSAEVMSLGDITEILKSEFGDRFAFPRETALPEGFPHWRANNNKSRTALGLDYRPVRPAIIAMFQQLIDAGIVRPRGTIAG